MDTGDDDAQCIAFDEEFGVEYPTISGVEGGGNAVCDVYGIGAYPTVILIAPDRTIVEQDIWPIATAQTIIDVLEGHGLEAHECPPPIGIEEPTVSLVNISSVYPNPASTNARIEVMSETTSNAQFEVYNSIGILAMDTWNVYLKEGINNFEFSVADLPAGTYFIRLRKENELLGISRLSVSRQ
jgi:hypothetical protein